MRKLVIFAIFLQFFALCLFLVFAFLPLVVGKEMRVSVYPFDPRDIFRGNYVKLSYNMEVYHGYEAKSGDIIYAKFRDENGSLVFDEFSKDMPKQGAFIRGKINNCSYDGECDVKFGIEAYFLPKEKALKAEEEIMEQNITAIAVLKVQRNGKARIENLIINGEVY